MSPARELCLNVSCNLAVSSSHPASAAMAATDLNAGARPYHRRRSNRPHPSPLRPPPPPVMPPAYYYGGNGCPLVPNYPHAAFPDHYLPLPPFFRNHGPSPPFFRSHAPPPPRRHHHRPRAPMFPNNRGGAVCEKLYAQAMFRCNKARAVVAAGGWGEPAPAPPRRRGVPACGPRAWTRGRGKADVPGARAARSPSPPFTTRPETWIPPPAWFGRTTVMIRNIPCKLTRAGMMELLDDHCARENRRRRGPPAAYDFLYLPMDFRQRGSNRGYAFVNFTTADGARGLHFALHGCRWKPRCGSSKTINIAAAHTQGKRAVVRRLGRCTFVCHTDEFLPAVFCPPRDGAARAPPRTLGLRIPPLVFPAALQVQQLPPPPAEEEPAQQQLADVLVQAS